jgi:Predicted hydrolases or acyltransferases (alpha/beta hydrolase superfamily)
MIEDTFGRIDYDESGHGPTVVLVPGSCSTGAAWRPVIAAWDGAFRTVTTSLSGYGGTAERRSAWDCSVDHEADIVDAVVRKAGGPVHLVGHSFGAVASLALALRGHTALASLTLMEPPAPELLRAVGEQEHYQAFRRMTDAYVADFAGGNRAAIASMIDFYGGAGTYDSWPAKVRSYAEQTTPVNILDWASAYGFALNPATLAAIDLPTLVICGGKSHRAMQRLCAALAWSLKGTFETLRPAAHFMIATHAGDVARRITEHVRWAEVSDRRGICYPEPARDVPGKITGGSSWLSNGSPP